MKIINHKTKKNITSLSKAVRNKNFADDVQSPRFEKLEERFKENQQIFDMNGKVPLSSKINVLDTLKIRNKDKVMGLVPEDY